ncbi:MAG: MCE family protein [Silicimonas sp.]|nr:MCE family protein [Silicimonas sp.]
MTHQVPELPTGNHRTLSERVSIVWLVPIAALLISLWVAWQSYADRGPLIEIAFQEASGIRAGETDLRFRDVTVGIVEDVGFSPTLDTVRVSVRLDKSVAAYADDDAAFWIVRPEVTTQGVSGLDTVLSGVFIEASWDTEPSGLVVLHQGADTPPLVRTGQQGLAIRLSAGPGTQLTGGTPILHRGIEVGRLGEPELDENGTVASSAGIIFEPYDRLISSNTRFWDTSGFTFSLGANGAEIDFSSLATLIAGGVAFDTVVSGGAPATDGAIFTLYVDEAAARASLFQENAGPIINLTAIFEENFSGLTAGAPVFLDGVRIGEVANLSGIVDEERFGDSKVRLTTSMSLRTSSFGLSEASDEAALAFLAERVEGGLRARLATASLLTGGLKIELVTLPGVPADTLDLGGDPFPIMPVSRAEISDVSATAEGVMERINNLPIEELLEAATEFLTAATTLASDEDIKALPGEVKGLVAEARALAGSQDVQGLPAQASQLLGDLQALSGDLRKITQSIETAEAVGRVVAAVDAAALAATDVSSSVNGVPDLVAKLTDVASKAEALELQELVSELSVTIGTARDLLADEGTKALPTRLGDALGELEAALAELREGGAVENLNETMASASDAAAAVKEASANLPDVIARLEAVAAQATSTLAGFSEDSDLNRAARAALRELQDAARAVEQLARTLERSPNSIILGR